MVPEITHHPLARADSSATFTSNLYNILASVNGPVEVQRRDELPEEAAIEINIRPSSGSGGPRERWLESIVHATVRSVLLVHLHPRTLVQITLQVTKQPALKLRQAVRDVSIVPSLLNAAFLALVDGGLPLATTLSAALVTVSEEGRVVLEPGEKDLAVSKSVHAQAYNGYGEMLLDESAGSFEMETWEAAALVAANACKEATRAGGEDDTMANGTEEAPWLRQALEERVREAGAWRET